MMVLDITQTEQGEIKQRYCICVFGERGFYYIENWQVVLFAKQNLQGCVGRGEDSAVSTRARAGPLSRPLRPKFNKLSCKGS